MNFITEIGKLGGIFRVFKSSNNWVVAGVCGALFALMINYNADPNLIAKLIAAVAGISVGGSRLEDTAKKIGEAWKANTDAK